MKQKISQNEKYLWQVFDDNQLRLFPKGNKVNYFSNNTSTRFMPANLINNATRTITVPDSLPTDILAKRGVVSGGFAEHTQGYYHSRKNEKFTDILCVIKGVLSAKFDGKKYKLKKGDALIIPPNRLCDSFVETNKTNVFWLHFKHNKYWSEFFGTEIHTKHFDRFEDIYSIMHVYFNEIYGKKRSMIILNSLADTLIELIKCEFSSFQHTTNLEVNEKVSSLFDTVEHFPEKDWNTKNVAKQLHVSVKYLDEYCQKITAQTFSKFVLKTRMRIAFEMLKSAKLSVSEISEKVGYSTPYSFSRIFKSYYGKSPRNIII